MKTKIIFKVNHLNNLTQIINAVHKNAVVHGFHPKNEKLIDFIGKSMANIHREVSELWEAFRCGQEKELCDKANMMRAHDLPPLSCEEEELADMAIRVFDLSKRLKIDLLRAILIKHAYNKTRPYKHGKKN